MPFKQDWHELAMKRMLRHAAENGYDHLAWTTGEQQAERYDLSKHIGRVTYDPTDSTLQAFDPSGNNVLIETVDPTANALSEYIGKEPAQKLMGKIDAYKPTAEGEDEPDIPELKGLDLKVGGEWAKALYDRAIPNFLSKYAKKWGAKVGTSKLPTTNPGTLNTKSLTPVAKSKMHSEINKEPMTPYAAITRVIAGWVNGRFVILARQRKFGTSTSRQR